MNLQKLTGIRSRLTGVLKIESMQADNENGVSAPAASEAEGANLLNDSPTLASLVEPAAPSDGGLTRLCQWDKCRNPIILSGYFKAGPRASIRYCGTCKILAKKEYDQGRAKQRKMDAAAGPAVAETINPQSEPKQLQQPQALLDARTVAVTPRGNIVVDAAPEIPLGPQATGPVPKDLFDDGHNCWGNIGTTNQLQLVRNFSYPRTNPIPPLREEDELLAMSKCIEHLHSLAPNHLVFAIEGSGSAANLRMLEEASGHNLSKAGVGYGCYLTGDRASPLQHFKLPCTMAPGLGTVPIHSARPAKSPSDFGLRLIPLPWHCPPLMKDADYLTLDAAERDSLRKLAEELTNGMQAFMLELVNTSYGFELRSTFLRKLRDLMDSFQARLCVDEVMTAGRSSDNFLLSDHFQLRAEYVSIGKFLTQGIVLEGLGVNPQDPDRRKVNGISLGTSLIRMELVLREISSFKKGTVDQARARMITHLQSLGKQPGDSHQQEFKVWGKGAILFCNVWCDRSGVVIGRYLPLMGTPPPSIDTSRSTMWDARDKKNEKIEPQILKEYLKVLQRMWNFCSKIVK